MKKKTVGNCAMMREALEKIAHYCDDEDNMDDPGCADGHILSDIAKAALDEPPRNCDIGTPEEQQQRFDQFCLKHDKCQECTCASVRRCSLLWAQLPYESEG